MQEVRIYYDDIIAWAIISLNKTKNRRSVTNHELKIFEKYIKAKAYSKNFSIFWDCSLKDSNKFEMYIDELSADGIIIYRLKPIWNVLDLKNAYILHTNQAILLSDVSLVVDLDDFNEKTEKEFPLFQRVDRKYQLKIMYGLFYHEREKRRLNQELEKIQENSICLADDLAAEEYLEQNPVISYSEYMKHFDESNARDK